MRLSLSSVSKSTLTLAIVPSGSTTPPCDVPVWMLILLMPTAPFASLFSSRVIAVGVSAQLFFVRVVTTHLADLAADRDGHTGRLVRADEGGEHRRKGGVQHLLFGHAGLAQVHQGGSIDIDIEETRCQALDDQVAYRLQLGVLVAGEALGRHLVMVALDEHRSLVAFRHCRRQDAGDVFRRALVGIAHLRAGDLENESRRVDRDGCPEDCPRRVESQRPQVHRRDGESVRHLALAACHVQFVDRSRDDANFLGDLAHQETRQPLAYAAFQRRYFRQTVDGGAQPGCVLHRDFSIIDADAVIQQRQKVTQILLSHFIYSYAKYMIIPDRSTTNPRSGRDFQSRNYNTSSFLGHCER